MYYDPSGYASECLKDAYKKQREQQSQSGREDYDSQAAKKDAYENAKNQVAEQKANQPQKPKAEVPEESSNANKSYQTYTKTNPQTGEVYSGRTSGTGTPLENVRRRDVNHHINDKGFGPAELDKSSTNRDAIRGREQQLIDKFGGAKSKDGTSGNQINGISDKNKKRERYFDATDEEFGKI